MNGLEVQDRIVFAVDIMFFIIRILEIFNVHPKLGPYVVMIGRMVNAKTSMLFRFFFQFWLVFQRIK